MLVVLAVLVVRETLAQPGPRLVPVASAWLLAASIERFHAHNLGRHHWQRVQRRLLLLVLLRPMLVPRGILLLLLLGQLIDVLLGGCAHALPVVLHGDEALVRLTSMLLQAALHLRRERRAGHVGLAIEVPLCVVHQAIELLANGLRRPGLGKWKSI